MDNNLEIDINDRRKDNKDIEVAKEKIEVLKVMATTEEDIIEYQKKAFSAFMICELITTDNIKFLQELYEFAFPKDNQILLEYLEKAEHTVIAGNVYNDIYQSMIFALADKIIDEHALAEKFISHYIPRYRNDAEFVIKMATSPDLGFNLDEDIDIHNFNAKTFAKKMMANSERLSLLLSDGDSAKIQFLLFIYLYYSNQERNVIPVKYYDEWYDRILYVDDEYDEFTNKINTELSDRMDWTDDFLKSSTYTKYIEKMKRQLAEAKGVDIAELYELIEIQSEFMPQIVTMAYYVVKKYKLNATRFRNSKTVEYTVSAEERVETYYKNRLLNYWSAKLEGTDSITKLDILRYMPESDYEEDYALIVNSYVMDIFALMYKSLLKEFYSNFSFEKISNRSIRERYADIISDYENNAQRQRDLFEQIRDENFRLKNLLEKKDFAESQKEYIKALEEELSKKNEEISKLKTNIQQKEAYIDLLMTEEEESKSSSTYDLEFLQTKRYMFVGREDKFINEIRKIFPNSVFITNNTTNIDGVKVDAAVYIIKTMSHALFYKAQSKFQSTDVPVIRYNGKNIENLLSNMYDELKDV